MSTTLRDCVGAGQSPLIGRLGTRWQVERKSRSSRLPKPSDPNHRLLNGVVCNRIEQMGGVSRPTKADPIRAHSTWDLMMITTAM